MDCTQLLATLRPRGLRTVTVEPQVIARKRIEARDADRHGEMAAFADGQQADLARVRTEPCEVGNATQVYCCRQLQIGALDLCANTSAAPTARTQSDSRVAVQSEGPHTIAPAGRRVDWPRPRRLKARGRTVTDSALCSAAPLKCSKQRTSNSEAGGFRGSTSKKLYTHV